MSEGFAIVPNWLIRDSEASIYVLTVYAALSSRADKTGVCWPSIATIATEARCSESTAKKALGQLKDMGLLTWSRRFDGDRSLSNLYHLNMSISSPETGGRATAPSGEHTPGGRTTVGEGPHHGYKEEPPKKNQKKKTKARLSDARATDDQISFRRDCHILLHGETPSDVEENWWANMSRAEIDQEIKDYWTEIEHGALFAETLLEVRDSHAGGYLSQKARDFIERRLVA